MGTALPIFQVTRPCLAASKGWHCLRSWLSHLVWVWVCRAPSGGPDSALRLPWPPTLLPMQPCSSPTGRNEKGQLGHGDTKRVEAPRLLEGLSHEVIVSAACGRNHTLALTGKEWPGPGRPSGGQTAAGGGGGGRWGCPPTGSEGLLRQEPHPQVQEARGRGWVSAGKWFCPERPAPRPFGRVSLAFVLAEELFLLCLSF